MEEEGQERGIAMHVALHSQPFIPNGDPTTVVQKLAEVFDKLHMSELSIFPRNQSEVALALEVCERYDTEHSWNLTLLLRDGDHSHEQSGWSRQSRAMLLRLAQRADSLYFYDDRATTRKQLLDWRLGPCQALVLVRETDQTDEGHRLVDTATAFGIDVVLLDPITLRTIKLRKGLR